VGFFLMEKTFGFFFIFSLLEPIALGKKKTKKKEKKQNNTIRMLLDLVFFFRFPPEIHPLRRGELGSTGYRTK